MIGSPTFPTRLSPCWASSWLVMSSTSETFLFSKTRCRLPLAQRCDLCGFTLLNFWRLPDCQFANSLCVRSHPTTLCREYFFSSTNLQGLWKIRSPAPRRRLDRRGFTTPKTIRSRMSESRKSRKSHVRARYAGPSHNGLLIHTLAESA